MYGILLKLFQDLELVISGYSGGITANPTYREVHLGDTGHFEVVEIIYDEEKILTKNLLKNFWINIDPFDAYGQFCSSKSFHEDINKDL